MRKVQAELTTLLRASVDLLAAGERDFRDQFLQRNFFLGVFFDTCERFVELVDENRQNLKPVYDELLDIRKASYELAAILPRIHVLDELESIFASCGDLLFGATLEAFEEFKAETVYEAYYESICINTYDLLKSIEDGALHDFLYSLLNRALNHDSTLTPKEVISLLNESKQRFYEDIGCGHLEGYYRLLRICEFHEYREYDAIDKPEIKILPAIVFVPEESDVRDAEAESLVTKKDFSMPTEIIRTLLFSYLTLNQMVVPVAATSNKRNKRREIARQTGIPQEQLFSADEFSGAVGQLERRHSSNVIEDITRTLAITEDRVRAGRGHDVVIDTTTNIFRDAYGNPNTQKAFKQAYEQSSLFVDKKYRTTSENSENVDDYFTTRERLINECEMRPELVSCRLDLAESNYYYATISHDIATGDSGKSIDDINRILVSRAAEILRGLLDWQSHGVRQRSKMMSSRMRKALVKRYDAFANVIKWMPIRYVPFSGYRFTVPGRAAYEQQVGLTLQADVTWGFDPNAGWSSGMMTHGPAAQIMLETPIMKYLRELPDDKRYDYLCSILRESPEEAVTQIFNMYILPLIPTNDESRYKNIIDWGMILLNQNTREEAKNYASMIERYTETNLNRDYMMQEAIYYVLTMMTGREDFLNRFIMLFSDRSTRIEAYARNPSEGVGFVTRSHLDFMKMMLVHLMQFVPQTNSAFTIIKAMVENIDRIVPKLPDAYPDKSETNKHSDQVDTRPKISFFADLSVSYAFSVLAVVGLVIVVLYLKFMKKIEELTKRKASINKLEEKQLRKKQNELIKKVEMEEMKKTKETINQFFPSVTTLKSKVERARNGEYKVSITVSWDKPVIGYHVADIKPDGSYGEIKSIEIPAELYFSKAKEMLSDYLHTNGMMLIQRSYQVRGISFNTTGKKIGKECGEFHSRMTDFFRAHQAEERKKAEKLEEQAKDETRRREEKEQRRIEKEKQAKQEARQKDQRLKELQKQYKAQSLEEIEERRKDRRCRAKLEGSSSETSPKLRKNSETHEKKKGAIYKKSKNKLIPAKHSREEQSAPKKEVAKKTPSPESRPKGEVKLVTLASTKISPTLFASKKKAESVKDSSANNKAIVSPVGLHITDLRKPTKSSLRDCLQKLETCHEEDLTDLTAYRMYYHLVETVVDLFEHEREIKEGSNEPSRIYKEDYKSLLSLRHAIVDHPDYYLMTDEGKALMIRVKNELLTVFADVMSADDPKGKRPVRQKFSKNWLRAKAVSEAIAFHRSGEKISLTAYLKNMRDYIILFKEITTKLDMADRSSILRSESQGTKVLNYMHYVTAGASLIFAVGECLKSLSLNYRTDYNSLRNNFRRTFEKNLLSDMYHKFKEEMRDVLAHEVDGEVVPGDYSVRETFSAERLLDHVNLMREILADNNVVSEINKFLGTVDEEDTEVVSVLAM